jgi:predicted enzyme related to lactoylglutathione lyase
VDRCYESRRRGSEGEEENTMSESSGRVGWLRAVVIDAHDPEALSTFWQAVLGVGVYEVEQDWIQLQRDPGGVYLAFQPLPPGGVAGTARLRPDVEVADMDAAQARIEALGGSLVAVIQEPDGDSHRRMADPEGNQFTILLPLAPDA